MPFVDVFIFLPKRTKKQIADTNRSSNLRVSKSNPIHEFSRNLKCGVGTNSVSAQLGVPSTSRQTRGFSSAWIIHFTSLAFLSEVASEISSNLVGGWTNPIKKYAQVKMGASSPSFGVKMINIWKTTTLKPNDKTSSLTLLALTNLVAQLLSTSMWMRGWTHTLTATNREPKKKTFTTKNNSQMLIHKRKLYFKKNMYIYIFTWHLGNSSTALTA